MTQPQAHTQASMTATITTGDCIEHLTALPPGSVDLIVADPPYNIGIDYGNGQKADRLSDGDYINWTYSWIQKAADALRYGGSLWVICGQEYGAYHDLAIRAAGLTIRSRITWHETFGVNCRDKFGRTSRPIFYAVKGGDYTFNREAVTRPSDRQLKYNDKRANPAGKIWDDVWRVSRVCGTFKERVKGVPTQLPVALVTPIVLCSSNPGDLVVDPFAGSGTTGVVCVEHGRRFIGIELRESFAEVARRRIAGARGRD